MLDASNLRRLVALSLALTALLGASAASGHGEGGAPLGYASTIVRVEPTLEGASIEVLDADDRLLLVNESGKTIVVLGYDGEPYLRVTPDGVFRNARSPAAWLNEDRFADVDLPSVADAGAAPEWERVADEPRVEWHDHRIHWMSTTPPPVVQEDPDSPHRILDWEVLLEVEGSPVVVTGALDYTPPDEGGFSPILLVPPIILAMAGGAFWWLRRRAGGGEEAAASALRGTRVTSGDDSLQ